MILELGDRTQLNLFIEYVKIGRIGKNTIPPLPRQLMHQTSFHQNLDRLRSRRKTQLTPASQFLQTTQMSGSLVINSNVVEAIGHSTLSA